MNLLDNYIAKIPLSEVTIKTTINSVAVLERIEWGTRPCYRKPFQGDYFTFHSSYYGNYFRVQSHFRKSDGKDTFPKYWPTIRIAFLILKLPFGVETSPVFYGRVFDDGDQGATIKGHFGIPFPILSLFCVLLLMLIAKSTPDLKELTLTIAAFLLFWSIISVIEFIVERKGIIDFLAGLFHDVYRKEIS